MPGEPEPDPERLAKRANDVLTHLNFGKSDEPLVVKVAISGTGVDGALKT